MKSATKARPDWIQDAPYLWNRPYYSIFVDALTANVAFAVLGFLASAVEVLPHNVPLGVLWSRSLEVLPIVALFIGLLYLMLLDWSVARYIDSFTMHLPNPWSWRFTADLGVIAGFYGAMWFAMTADARFLLCMAAMFFCGIIWCGMVFKQGSNVGIREQCRRYCFSGACGIGLSLGAYEILSAAGQPRQLTPLSIGLVDLGIAYWILFEKGMIEWNNGLFEWHGIENPQPLISGRPRRRVGLLVLAPLLFPARGIGIIFRDTRLWPTRTSSALRSQPIATQVFGGPGL